MKSKIVGQLIPHELDPDFFESEPFEIPYFENMALKVGFVEAKHQPYLDIADRVLENFLKLNSTDKIRNSEMVYHYFKKTLRNGSTNNISNIQDIWNFVKPTDIIIHWDENNDFFLCVSCDCEWEKEHGLQLVFKNGETLTRASGHDGHFKD
jgi:hypothetical protein